MRPKLIGLLSVWMLLSVGCDESIEVTDVSGNQPNTIEYPCLSSSDDCLNSISIEGGTFQFFFNFSFGFCFGGKRCNYYHPWTH